MPVSPFEMMPASSHSRSIFFVVFSRLSACLYGGAKYGVSSLVSSLYLARLHSPKSLIENEKTSILSEMRNWKREKSEAANSTPQVN